MPHSQVDTDSKKRNPLAPRVHRGFFASWHHNGLNERVLAHIRDLVASRKTAELTDLRVIVTGVPAPRVATSTFGSAAKAAYIPGPGLGTTTAVLTLD